MCQQAQITTYSPSQYTHVILYVVLEYAYYVRYESMYVITHILNITISNTLVYSRSMRTPTRVSIFLLCIILLQQQYYQSIQQLPRRVYYQTSSSQYERVRTLAMYSRQYFVYYTIMVPNPADDPPASPPLPFPPPPSPAGILSPKFTFRFFFVLQGFSTQKKTLLVMLKLD